MHVFKYSPRSKTKAAKMENQIDGSIKEERSNSLIELSDKNEKEYLDTYIGKTVEVLFEKQEGEYIKGHLRNYIEVKIENLETPILPENSINNVYVVKREGLLLIGEKGKM